MGDWIHGKFIRHLVQRVKIKGVIDYKNNLSKLKHKNENG